MSHLHQLLACLALAAFCTPAIGQTPKASKPNIIVLLLDDGSGRLPALPVLPLRCPSQQPPPLTSLGKS